MKNMFAQGGSGSAGIKTNKQAIARASNVKVSEVIYSNDTAQSLDNKKVIYDVPSQVRYKLPALPTGAHIVSVSNGKLTYSPGNIEVDLIVIPDVNDVQEDSVNGIQAIRNDLGANTGATIVKTSTGESVETRLTNSEAKITNLTVMPRRAAEIGKLLTSGTNIVIDCEGDSTMWGATALDTGTQNAFNAPAVLRTTITNLFGQTPTVNNNGISGLTMRDLIAGTNGYSGPYATRIAASSAILVYCNHGINDSQLNLDINQYRKDVESFVNLTRAAGKVPVLVTPNINPATGNDSSGAIITESKSKRLFHYVEVMRAVAKGMNVDLVDNYHYYERTCRMVSPVTLVPDGAHPSTEGYKMSGRNMAIPLVSAHVLSGPWDKAGLGNTTYFDNISTTRQYQTNGSPFSRFNGNLSGVRTAALNGINMAVVLDVPTDDTVLALYGLQWSSGTISQLYENGSAVGTEFGGNINQYNNISTTDWDACYIPDRCKLYAGLHVIGMLSNTSLTGASGEGFALSGVGLVPRIESNAGMVNSVELRNFNPVCANSILEFELPIFTAGTQFTLKGCSNDTAIINIEWAGAGGALTVTTSGGGTYSLAGAVSAAVYRTTIKFNSDKTVNVSVGAASATIPAGTSPWPNMYVGTAGQTYTLKYTG